MKLRNKKTGEIVELLARPSFVKRNKENYLVSEVICFDSLAELEREWEDYEEPKEYWHIFGTNITKTQEGLDELYDERNKEIGNYFETKEEAEKAVEKLKAWKRLKGEIVGWSFSYDLDLNGCGFNDDDIVVGIKLPRNVSKKDLDFLFGGEE